eukprot:gene21178-biopygen16167
MPPASWGRSPRGPPPKRLNTGTHAPPRARLGCSFTSLGKDDALRGRGGRTRRTEPAQRADSGGPSKQCLFLRHVTYTRKT